MSTRIFFDIPHTYYLPQYAPVIRILLERGVECHGVLYHDNDDALKEMAASGLGLELHWANSKNEALALYAKQTPRWVIFGNDFEQLKSIAPKTRTALVFHGSGTGIKSASLSPNLANFDVRFVSGPGRMPIFKERYPNVRLVEVGFAKLDPLRDPAELAKIKFDLKALGLSPNKPTILYAPTFYPSSIRNMGAGFPSDFSDYNILIKAHDFTLHKKKYAHQLKKLNSWANAENVFLASSEEYSLVPFMASADLMLTDTSSAIYEFASLDKPVVICDFPHLRWSYRGPFRYRLKRRLDPSTEHLQAVAARAASYSKLKSIVEQHLREPSLLQSIRLKYSAEIMGNTDGQAAHRIAGVLLDDSPES
jgi:hypothetical protein